MRDSVWIKSNLADKALEALRYELINLFEPNSTLIDIGCGTGDLLFKSATKLKFGTGIDLNEKMITFANLKKEQLNVGNLKFECLDALELRDHKFDIATCTLFLHELNKEQACKILERMLDLSERVVVADYSEASSLFGKISIEFDEFISGHFFNYRNYRKNGEIPMYAKSIGGKILEQSVSSIDGIKIWVIK